ncbi:MAG: energy transducer TonB [Alphaproteobacteria bacterium]|nr:energy transducer TonB [Alphaproteobacteria bacterium]
MDRPEDNQARWLTRRLWRGDRVGMGARWAALASVWVHLGVVVSLAVAHLAPVRPVEHPAPAPIELVVLPPEQAHRPPPPPVPEERTDGVPRHGARSTRIAASPAPARSNPEPAVADVKVEASPEVLVAEAVQLAPAPRVDPLDELREALGFAPIDRSRLGPRRTLQGAMFQDLGPGCTLEEPADGEPDPTWESAAAAHGTPLGAYIEDIEAQVFARWRSTDLDTHARAVGIQGDVAVQYTIAANGTVRDVRVSRSSGLPALDAMAVHAIPLRLPRLPRELGLTELRHEILFRYHNPP